MTNDNENTTDTNTGNESEPMPSASSLFDREFFGIKRHELIAGTAEEFLGERAREQVARILESIGGVGLADIAGWADTVKRRKPRADDDEETVAFLEDERNADNDIWHYVNLPLDAEEYSREKYPELTRDDDVVQTMCECVRVLQGNSDRFSEVNALRLLTHLAGDVHQPIHVGCCYIDKSGQVARLVRDPKAVVENNLQHDQGGNRIILPVGNSGASLHSYWDSRLGGSNPDISDPVEGDAVESDAETADESSQADAPPEVKRQLIEKLRDMIAEDETMAVGVEAVEADAATPEEWAAQWATDSLDVARLGYKSLKITGPNAKEKTKFDVSWEGQQKYDQRCGPLVINQMKLAARNLAAMLDAIWP